MVFHLGTKVLVTGRWFSPWLCEDIPNALHIRLIPVRFCELLTIIGNCCVPEESFDEDGISRFMDSDRIEVRGLDVSDYSENYSHWKAAKNLGEWLEEHKISGIYSIDTRELTKAIRDKGTMVGIIVSESQDKDFLIDDPGLENLVAEVSCKDITEYGGDKKVVLLDCGIRHNILRYFAGRYIRLIRVPWNYDFNALAYDCLILFQTVRVIQNTAILL